MADSHERVALVVDCGGAGRYELDGVSAAETVGDLLVGIGLERIERGECQSPIDWLAVSLKGQQLPHAAMVGDLNGVELTVRQEVSVDNLDALENVYESSPFFRRDYLRTGVPNTSHVREQLQIRKGMEELLYWWLLPELIVQSLLIDTERVFKIAMQLAETIVDPCLAAPHSFCLLKSFEQQQLRDLWPSTTKEMTEENGSQLEEKMDLKDGESERPRLSGTEFLEYCDDICQIAHNVPIRMEVVLLTVGIRLADFQDSEDWLKLLLAVIRGKSRKLGDGIPAFVRLVDILIEQAPGSQRLKEIRDELDGFDGVEL